MKQISFDPESCTHCGICADICPASLIQMNGRDDLPYIPENLRDSCIMCGNCEAFCPNSAVSSGSELKHFAIPGTESAVSSPEQIGHYMCLRRSIRNYRDKSVDRDIVDKILDVVRYAPSAANKRPVHWLIVHDPEEVRKIASLTIDGMRKALESDIDPVMKPAISNIIAGYEMGADPICRGAPHLAIAYAPADNPMAYTDSVIALSWFELIAPAYGVGTCWAGFLKAAADSYPPLTDELNLPEGFVFQHAMMFGFPKYKVRNIPPRDVAKVIWK